MKNAYRILLALAVTGLLAAVVAGPGLSAKPATVSAKKITLKASFNGKAVLKIVGNKADITSAQATGSGTPIGKATMTGKGSGGQADPCPFWSGPGTITSGGGNINFTVGGGSACTDEGAQEFSLSARAKITGGTGKYAKAKGSLKITGTYSRGTGLFSVKVRGTITL